MRAVDALGHLMPLQTRVDPLCTELLNSVAQTSDAAISETTILAIASVVGTAGQNVTPPVLARVIEDLQQTLQSQADEVQAAGARGIGEASRFLGDDEFEALWRTLTAVRIASVLLFRAML